jgi:hypothetical protein
MFQTAIYDACVLYPASLRSFLMWMGVNGLVHARWTERILEECFDNLLKNRPDLEAEDLERTRRLMCSAIPDCIVTGYEGRISEVTLPDTDDRHVLAAAIESGADCIVTFNLRDFPDERLGPHGVEAVHPDEFVLGFVEREPDIIADCLEDESSIREHPPKSVNGIIDALRRSGLVESGEEMRGLVSE